MTPLQKMTPGLPGDDPDDVGLRNAEVTRNRSSAVLPVVRHPSGADSGHVGGGQLRGTVALTLSVPVSPATTTVGGVVGVRAQPEVTRSNAWRVVARVKNRLFAGQFAVGEEPGPSVSKLFSVAPRFFESPSTERPVSPVSGTGLPLPAAVAGRIDLRPEPVAVLGQGGGMHTHKPSVARSVWLLGVRA